MKLFKQLYDPSTGFYYIVDASSLIFKVSSDEITKEIRLKPHFIQILTTLFNEHPKPVAYQKITMILKEHKLACPDETRLHRKVSELRTLLTKFHPGLQYIICNTRGLGYSLPVHLKEIESREIQYKLKISNRKIQNCLLCFEEYVSQSMELSRKCSIIKIESGYVLNRKIVNSDIEQLLENYQKQQLIIYDELRLHPADFEAIRMEFLLAKFKTYLGLARISEFSITKEQWLEWHEIEVRQTLNEIIYQIKQLSI